MDIDNNTELTSAEYYNLALNLFEQKQYENSVINFIMAYNLDYEQENIIKFLYDCFITPNKNEFESSYQNQTETFKNHLFADYIPEYDSLHLDFIPVEENIYYIYDTQDKTFCGCIDITSEFLEKKVAVKLPDDFSDITVNYGWNISSIHTYISASKGRLLYFVTDNYIKTISFLKIPQLTEFYINNMLIFDTCEHLKNYLHKNTDIFIPRILYGAKDFKSSAIQEIFEREHLYRLTPAGRNTDKLILSICIPTWDRGHRALSNIKRLLTLPYDSEIEIVVSNNGSILHTEEYKEISKISDSRIVYSAFNENKGFSANVIQVVRLSNAPFSLILSDEDNLIFENLPHYLQLLRKYPSLSIVRSGSMKQYINIQDCYAKAGEEAFEEFFLRNNYISGIIYNKRLFMELDLDTLFISFSSLISDTYPHMWIDALLTFKGDFISCKKPLIDEGASALEEQVKNYSNYNTFFPEALNRIPIYATIEHRQQQHRGFVELLNHLPFTTIENKIKGYMILSIKTEHVFHCSKQTYLDTGMSLNNYCLELKNVLDEGIDLLNPAIDDNQKNELQLFNAHLVNKLSAK